MIYSTGHAVEFRIHVLSALVAVVLPELRYKAKLLARGAARTVSPPE